MAGTLTVDTIQSDSSYASTLNVASKINFTSGMQIGGQDTTFGGMRNRIINGNMSIAQRGTSFSGLTDGNNATYQLDRWGWQETGTSTGVQTISQDTTSPPTGFINSLKVLTTTAHSVGTGNAYGIFQHIEGLNCSDLDWGKSTAKPITVSFWVKSSLTGTFAGAIKNGANFDRSYIFNYTINAANTWEYKIVTIPGDTTGTWPTDTSRGIMLNFDLGTGSTYQGTANTWTAGNVGSTSGSQSVVGTLNATWNITGVQLEKGSAASAFEQLHYGHILALCQRYFCKTFSQSVAVAQNTGDRVGTETGNNLGGGYGTFRIGKFPVNMRAAPAVTGYNPNAANGLIRNTSTSTDIQYVGIQYISEERFTFYPYGTNHDSATGNQWAWHWTASAEL